MPDEPAKLESPNLSALYGQGYFHGANSGYPAEGYRASHPDFGAWLDLISLLVPKGTLVDLGCAFGYLVFEANRRGYQAWGFDISDYALRQEADHRPYLTRSLMGELPVRSASADIATLLDVVEHLPRPETALAEVRRILKPDGLLVLATPDPIYFDRHEPTHFHERPPSYWIRLLKDIGFEVCFRFSEVPYNFQLLATPAGSKLSGRIALFQHDYYTPDPDFCRSDGLTVVPRSGWGPLSAESRPIRSTPATVYLLNESDRPQATAIGFELRSSGRFSSLQLRLDSLVIGEVPLSSEVLSQEIHIEGILVPAGGHHLIFEVLPGGPEVRIGGLSLRTRPAARKELAERLPFDLYQRYEHAARLAEALQPARILDLGGMIGDRDGHLAHSSDFFVRRDRPVDVVSSDFRQCDHPSHVPADGLNTPFEDGAFDLVVSMDVLEHVPPDSRPRFLGELDRLASKWILVGAPFASPLVEAAERSLSESLMKGQVFLEEHRKFGLPELSETIRFFEQIGDRKVTAYPNGTIPDWVELQAWTQLLFSLREYRLITEFNRITNRYRFSSCLRTPSYRHLLLIAKGSEPLPEVGRFGDPDPDLDARNLAAWSNELPPVLEPALSRLSATRKALTDVQFLVNARLQLIDLLTAEVGILKQDSHRLSLELEAMSQKYQQTEREFQELRSTPVLRIAWNRWKARQARRGGNS